MTRSMANRLSRALDVGAARGGLQAFLSGIALCALTTSAAVQSQERLGLFEKIPEVDYRDENQVDFMSGSLRFSHSLLSIGDNGRPLTLGIFITSPAKEYLNVATHSCSGWCNPIPLGQHMAMGLSSLVSLSDDDDLGEMVRGNTKAIKLPYQSARFSFRAASLYQSMVPDGSQLVPNGAQCCGTGFSYTGRDGTQAVIGTAKISSLLDSHYPFYYTLLLTSGKQYEDDWRQGGFIRYRVGAGSGA